MTYPLTIYTDNLPARFGGTTYGPVILIRPAYRGDVGLHRHELTHVKQWACLPILHNLLYKFHRPYRLWAEVEAYREQMRYHDKNGNKLPIDIAARFIAANYDLGITVSEAKTKLEAR